MDKAVKISIITAVLIASLSIGYYFLVRPILDERKDVMRQDALNRCLDEAGSSPGRIAETARDLCVKRYK